MLSIVIGASQERHKPISHRKLTLLVVCLAFVLSIAFIAWRVMSPPAPFPIPPDLALAYPQALFDSPDNAWRLYKQLPPLVNETISPARFAATLEVRREWLMSDPRTWSPAARADAVAYISAYAPGIALLERAVGKPFFVPEPLHSDTRLDYLNSVRLLAEALVARAAFAELRGDEAAAVRDLTTVLRASAQVTHFGPLIARITSDAMAGAVFRHLQFTLPEGRYRRPETYRALLAALAAADTERAPLGDAWRMEYHSTHDTLERVSREGLRFIDPVAFNPLDPEFDARGTDWKDWFILSTVRFRFPAAHEKSATIFRRLADLADHDPATLIRSDPLKSMPEARDPIAGMFLPVTGGQVKRSLASIADNHALQLAAAIQWYRLDHRALPTTLDALVPSYLQAIPLDPFTGKPMQARREKDTWIVWSIGPDLKDDRGLVSRTPRYRLSRPGDLVWRLQPPK